MNDGSVARVFFNHIRPDLENPDVKLISEDFEEMRKANNPHTICEISFDGQTAKDTAFCHPNDQFVRKVGSKLAFSKALKKLNLDKPTRTELYQKVFNRK